MFELDKAIDRWCDQVLGGSKHNLFPDSNRDELRDHLAAEFEKNRSVRTLLKKLVACETRAMRGSKTTRKKNITVAVLTVAILVAFYVTKNYLQMSLGTEGFAAIEAKLSAFFYALILVPFILTLNTRQARCEWRWIKSKLGFNE